MAPQGRGFEPRLGLNSRQLNLFDLIIFFFFFCPLFLWMHHAVARKAYSLFFLSLSILAVSTVHLFHTTAFDYSR
jgi:hypothetical protein